MDDSTGPYVRSLVGNDVNAGISINPLDPPVSGLVKAHLEDARTLPRSNVDVALLRPRPEAPYRGSPPGLANTKADWSIWVGGPKVVLTLKVLTD